MAIIAHGRIGKLQTDIHNEWQGQSKFKGEQVSVETVTINGTMFVVIPAHYLLQQGEYTNAFIAAHYAKDYPAIKIVPDNQGAGRHNFVVIPPNSDAAAVRLNILNAFNRGYGNPSCQDIEKVAADYLQHAGRRKAG